MKRNKIIYWIFTGLLGALMTLGSIPDIMMHPEAVKLVVDHLEYPLYFLPFIGIAKILGVVAILTPAFNRLKEWAYAGLCFDLIGAMFSHISKGDPASKWAPIFFGLFLLFGSYVFHHKRLKDKANLH